MCICSLYYNIVTLTPKIYVSTIFTIFIYLCKINYIDILKLQRNYTHHILILRKTLCIHGTSLNSQIGIEIIRGIGTTPVLEYPNFTGCTPYILYIQFIPFKKKKKMGKWRTVIFDVRAYVISIGQDRKDVMAYLGRL